MIPIKKIVSVIAVCLLINGFSVYAQEKAVRFSYPLKVPMGLSGDYGELRSNHFHGGIDFRIGGVVGAPVYAAERGYVSRISVSGTGYGNALYITHPNGCVSVYGHLHKFAPAIAKFVKEYQYKNKSFYANIELDEQRFPVEKGDFIANAGNTGSSGGPHLHFEIRTPENVPQNVFAREYINVVDNTAPQIREVKFYGVKEGAPFVSKLIYSYNNLAKSKTKPVILLPDNFYVAIDAIDRIDGSTAKFAVENYEVYLDDELVYSFEVGEVPFEYGRYINSLMEYSQRVNNSKYMVKSYCEPGNILKDRITCVNNGIIKLTDSLVHRVKVTARDFSGNNVTETYKVKWSSELDIKDTVAAGNMAYWYMTNVKSRNGLDVIVPAGALYDNTDKLCVDSLPMRVEDYSPVWRIGAKEVPVQIPFRVKMACSLPDNLQQKALLCSVSQNKVSGGAGGEWRDGYLYADLYSFGDYTVSVDTVPPVVNTTLANNALIKGNTIVFKIKDNLSGIGKFAVEIDGKWVLSKWDAKTRSLTVDLAECGIGKGTHKVKIEVTDNKDNKTILTRNFKK